MNAILPLLLIACDPGTSSDPSIDPGVDPGVDPAEAADIVDLALDTPELSTLAQAVVDAGLEDTLRSDGDFTVFAPTNQAFEDLGVDLSTLSQEDLQTILTYHVIAGAQVDSGSVPAMADSVADYTLFFDTSSGVMVNDATVTTADVEASNGIVHVIDTVLMPPTLLDAVVFGGLDELAGAAGAADPAIVELLDAPGDFTVFAPTNEAFEAAADITAGLDQESLTGVLAYHVYPGRVMSDAVPFAADSLFANEAGYGVTALFDTSSGVWINGSSQVVVADIKTTNGVVHVVDAVMLPPSIVDHAQAAGLSSLIDTVGAASGDLGSTLSAPGSFTVFAPTNEAFEAIAEAAAGLDEDQLRDVLLYHVVGAYAASDSLSSGEVETLLGEDVDVQVDAGVSVNGATVLVADVHATNGVVHVIDAVLLP